MIWLVAVLSLALIAALWVIRHLVRATRRLALVIHRQSVPSETSSTCVDRVSYTIRLYNTTTLGPIE
jgi:hypothetical protein